MNIPMPKLIKELGINEGAHNQLKAKFTMNLALSGLKIADKGEVVATIPLSSDEIKNIAAGKPAPKKLQTIACNYVGKLLKLDPEEVSNDFTADKVDADDPDEGEEAPPPVVATVKKPTAKPSVSTADLIKMFGANAPIFKVEEMETANRVKLAQATKLYQPVSGSGASSRYFVIAIADGLKIAARFAGGKLSIRAEGEKLANYASLLSELSLSGNGSKHYSVHLSAEDEATAGKVIGAVLAGLGVPILSPMPLIQVISGKGA